MKMRKESLGLDGFYWWFGKVENRKDPKGAGRCQVRIYGAHSDDKSLIPTEDLPWAVPVNSININNFSTPLEGDMVFGFFMDGRFSQSPIMLGIVQGLPTEMPDPTKGFSDPRSEAEIGSSPKKPEKITLPTDGTGVSITEKTDNFDSLRKPFIDKPTNSDLVRNHNIENSIIQTRKDNLVSVTGVNDIWTEPSPAYAAEYPYNKVMETESGHIMEFDDTPGAERIHTYHRAGTFEEIYPNGSKVEKIVKNNYKIILADDHIYISGKTNITVDSHANIRVVGDVNLNALGDMNVGVAGDYNVSVGGDFKVKAAGIKLESSSDVNIKSIGSVKLGGSSIEVNGTLNGGQTNFKAIGEDTGGDTHMLNVTGTGGESPDSSGLDDAPPVGNPN